MGTKNNRKNKSNTKRQRSLNAKNNTQPMNDGLSSYYTSLGEPTARVNYSNSKKRLPDKEIISAYENSWLVARFINKTADDMLKKPREFKEKIDEKVFTALHKTESLANVDTVIKNALIWSKLLGDALIVAITNIENAEYKTALNLEKETIIKFIVLSKTEFKPNSEINSDISSLSFGEPVSYQVNVGKGFTVHHSRCLRLKNGVAMMSDRNEYGISEIQAAYEAIKAFDLAMLCISDLLQESNVDVIFMPNLNMTLSTPDGEEKMRRYTHVMKSMKSSTGIILMDSGQDGKNGAYEQKQVNFSGLSEVISKLAIVVGGALNRPLKILFGESAKGFATGEEDNTAYYETIHAEQESVLRKIHDFIDQFILHKQAGVIDYEFPSIDMPNDGEEAATFNTYVTAFATLINSQGLSAEQAIRELKQMGYLESMTDKDVNDLKDSYLGLPNGVTQST